ncbi:glycine zipper 2TM domain-containing protein [Marinicella sediminis]|uniref:Glycine zipper 2TM domain-containing protein n=1 Tax=Marinicella sediminis TaxID=1792834 RepID=A0ABV7JCA1_9GAMM|nr:glycine zipper 2TM domain-containing protein [Marinicella sediminis]
MNKLLTFSSLLLLPLIAVAGRYNEQVVYAPVLDVRPVYRTVSVPDRREVCDHRGYRHHRSEERSRSGAVIGGLLGGAIGNRFGKGSGRDVSTAVGIMIGASVGARKNKHRHTPVRCRTETRYHQEEQLSGYDVTYEYLGVSHQTWMNNYPGEHIRIRVDHQVLD